MDVGIIIVNYKTAKLTIECLRSLDREREHQAFQVIVVDNDSQDGSLELISSAITKENWSDWVTLKAAACNGGFSYGNNVGIRHFLGKKNPPKYIHLLNSDTVVHEKAIDELVNFLDAHPQAGIAGSRLENEEGIPYHASFQFHSFVTELDRGFSLSILSKLLAPWVKPYTHPTLPAMTDWVAGASMMIRTAIFTDIGLMDETYFLYYEEMDFCLQAKRAGWECWHVPESRVIHYEGSSTGVNNEQKKVKRQPKYWFDSRRRYFLKNFGILHAILADLFWLIGFSIWKLRNLVQRKSHRHPDNFLYDSFMNSVFVRGFEILPTKNK